MKKILLGFAAMLIAFASQAQLPSGSLAPDFTGTDLNGDTHSLYEYLGQGYTVVVDVSAAWCGPCWSYHNSGALETLWEEHGVDNGGNVIVLFVEGESQNTGAQLTGTSGAGALFTQGDWVSGTGYPIIDDASIADILDISYFPTIYTICPTGIITETGQITAAAHWNFINANACQTVPSTDAAVMNYSGTTLTCDDADIIVDLVNLGTDALTSATITVSGVTPALSYNWSGNLGQFESTTVDVGTAAVTGTVTVTISGTDGNNSNNSLVAPVSLAGESTTQVVVEILTDDWGDEVTWEIRNSNNTVVAEGGPYTGGSPQNVYETRFLPSTGCYSFVIYDAYGDGMFGSQWGATNGYCKVYGIQDNGNYMPTFYYYDGTYDYEEEGAAANVTTTVGIAETSIVSSFTAYPNPAAENATLNYSLIDESVVSIDVVNMLGQTVMNDFIGTQQVGNYNQTLDLSTLQSGIYMVNLRANGKVSTLRLNVSK